MRRALRYFLLAIVGLVVIAGLALATPPGRAVVAGIIERAASGNGLTVSIKGLSGWPPFWLGADTVVLSDADGPFAEIDNLSVNPKVLALLTGNFAFDTIAAERVEVTRRPNLPGGGGEGALLPFAADEVAVARLELGEELAGRPAALALNGSFTGGADGSIAASLNAGRIDGRAGTLAAAINRVAVDAPLAIDVRLSEAADGVLGRAIKRHGFEAPQPEDGTAIHDHAPPFAGGIAGVAEHPRDFVLHGVIDAQHVHRQKILRLRVSGFVQQPECAARTGVVEREVQATELRAGPLDEGGHRCGVAHVGGLKQRLAANRHTAPLFDTAGRVRALEAAFQEMYDRMMRGEPPASFDV